MEKIPGRWAVVLAAGEGERLRPLIRQYTGTETPKQFFSLTGGKTLLEETLDRVEEIIPHERTVTIIGRGHRKFLAGRPPLPGRLIEQPFKRETAPAVFLPAAHVLRADPMATVLIFPSDHFIAAGSAFSDCVARAATIAERWQDRIVLLGAVPDGPEEDYGWIEPDLSWSTPAGAMEVARFKEKPDAREAASLFERGGLWDTMVMAVKIKTLWRLGRACLPEMMEKFDKIFSILETSQQDSAPALDSIYERLDCFNFSKQIMERAPGRVMVLPMSGVEWSDLGRPDRALEVMRRLGAESAGPPAAELAGAAA